MLVTLWVAGCPKRVQSGDDAVTVSRDDGAAPSDTYGQVEFAGAADTEVSIRDPGGRIVHTGLVPFSVRLPAGSYTWSARFMDNQRLEGRPLAMMAGDDARVQVAPAGGVGAMTDDTEGARNAPLGDVQKDFNKPWVSTEPLVPTGPGGKAGMPGIGATKGEASPGGMTGSMGKGLSGDAPRPGPAEAPGANRTKSAATDE